MWLLVIGDVLVNLSMKENAGMVHKYKQTATGALSSYRTS